MMLSRTPNKRRGFNLIEAAIVLGIIGLVIGGIWVAAAKVALEMNIQEDYKAIMYVIDKNREYYKTAQGNISYTGDMFDYPDVFVPPGYKVISGGSSIEFKVTSGGMWAYDWSSDKFGIYPWWSGTSNDIAECTKLLVMLSSQLSRDGRGIYRLTDYGGITTTSAVSPSAAAQSCKANYGFEILLYY